MPPIPHFESLVRAPKDAASAEVPVVLIPRQTVPEQASRVLVQPCVDAKRRISVRRALTALGWCATTIVTAAITPGRVTCSASVLPKPLGVRRVDRTGRMQLSPAMCFALGVAPGARVQVVADAEQHTLTLLATKRFLDAALLARDASSMTAERP